MNFDASKKNIIKFADGRTIIVEGVGKVIFKMKDETQSYIIDVLYVLGMKSNLISLGLLLEKGHSLIMEDKILEPFDRDNKSKALFMCLCQGTGHSRQILKLLSTSV